MDGEAIAVHAVADHWCAEEAPAGALSSGLCREHGIGKATFYA
jgi:hypothetical protein